MPQEAETPCLKGFVLFCFKESFGFLCVFGFLRMKKKKKEQGVAGSFESLFGTTPLEQVAREGL